MQVLCPPGLFGFIFSKASSDSTPWNSKSDRQTIFFLRPVSRDRYFSANTEFHTVCVDELSLAVHAVTFAVEWAFSVSHATLGSKTSICRSLCWSLFPREKFRWPYLGKAQQPQEQRYPKPVYFVCIPHTVQSYCINP